MKKELPRPLGRWRIEDCHSKLNTKIDLSNEDHCGPCGKYALERSKLLVQVDSIIQDVTRRN